MEITDLVYHPKAEKNLSMLELKTTKGPHFKLADYAFQSGFGWSGEWGHPVLTADFRYAFD